MVVGHRPDSDAGANCPNAVIERAEFSRPVVQFVKVKYSLVSPYFIEGMGNTHGKSVIFLNVDSVLSKRDISAMEGSVASSGHIAVEF